mgnify:FL=1
MKEKNCENCNFSERAYQGRDWCNIAHGFSANFGTFCPKGLKPEEIKKNCRHYNIKNAYCTVHVAEGQGVHLCWITGLKGPTGLEGDPDFSVKTGN